MVEQSILLSKEDYDNSILQSLMKNLAHQKALMLFLCDRNSQTIEGGDALYQEMMKDCNQHYQKIVDDIYARRVHINPTDIGL